VVKLVVSLLQLSKMAVNQTGEREVLGKWCRQMVFFSMVRMSISSSFDSLEN
jgi:hypothetical protein